MGARRKRLSQSREIPIAFACGGTELLKDFTLRGGESISGKDRLDTVFDAQKCPEHDTIFRAPHEENFRFVPSKNQVFEVNRHMRQRGLGYSLGPFLSNSSRYNERTGTRSCFRCPASRWLFATRLHGDDKQGAFEASEHAGEGNSTRHEVLRCRFSVRAQDNVVGMIFDRLLEDFVHEKSGHHEGFDLEAAGP